MIVAGNGIYEKCGWCGQLVKLNKFIFGSLHPCIERPETGTQQYNNLMNAYEMKKMQEQYNRSIKTLR